jgi:diguanylate cyclase (GGDEF)-like protein
LADNPRMRLRFLIGLLAVIAIAAGSVAAALIVHHREADGFHREQRDEAERAAHEAEAVASLSVEELRSSALFFGAEARGGLTRPEFDLVARSLLREPVLTAAAFVAKVPLARRSAYERATGVQIVEAGPGGGLRPATRRAVYYPITYVRARGGGGTPLGLDLGTEPDRSALLGKARDSARATATGVLRLPLGHRGLIVYRPVYRPGAPTATVAERRAALLGFLGGSFEVSSLAAAAVSAVPDAVDLQLRTSQRLVAGVRGALEDPATSSFRLASQTWLLVVRDPARPGPGLPLLLGVGGLCLAGLLGALIFVWSRNERMRLLQREASEDPLTGLENRRRFDEDLRLAMARARRERTTGALLMLDLDHFKLVNDTHGHQAGDRLIVEVAAALRRRTRESDSLARLGGDEFAVILPRCTVHEARLAAEGVAAAIREHAPDLDGAEPISASIGIAMFGDRPRTSTDSIVSEADAAMYAAKDEGRDAIRVFDRDAILDDARGGR